MNSELKQRIEQIQRGEVPEGYRRTKDIGMAPKEWRIGKLSDVLHNEQRPVPKPDKPYWRLGVKSWAKGTFHAYVDDPSTVDMGELYVVKEKDLVVNITFAWEHAIALAKKEDEGLLVSHRFPTYMFDDGNVPEFYQAVFGQPFFKDLLDNISPGGAGRNRVLNRKDFLNLPCYIPPIEEQRKIAEILATCDRVIQLKQKLLDELKKLKKVCLEKMFPQEGSSVPEIRFSGFTAPWEQRKLSDLAEIVGGGTPDTNNSAYWDGDIDWYAPAEMEGQRYAKGSVRKITELGLQKSSAKILPAHRTVLFTSRAGIGKMAILQRSAATNQGFQSLVLKDGTDPYFIYSMGEKIKDMAECVASGSTFLEISGKMLGNLEVMVPNLKEQESIATFFRVIDDLITLHQRELEAEQQKKKALMQLLLTGIVRAK